MITFEHLDFYVRFVDSRCTCSPTVLEVAQTAVVLLEVDSESFVVVGAASAVSPSVAL